jgi:prepilin-type N-terminal cleavage/methylation domain-containing protein
MKLPCPGAAVPFRARAPHAGFTLMEVMLALAVSAIVLAAIGGVFFSALRLRDHTTAMLDAGFPIQQSLAALRRDLRGAMPPGPLNQTLVGDFRLEGGSGAMSGSMSSRLQFFTTSGNLADDQTWGDVQEVVYELRDPVNRNSTGTGKDLVRSITRNLLTSTPQETDEQFLASNIESIEISCFDGMDWRDTWDTSLGDTNLPSAVRVRISQTAATAVPGGMQPFQLVIPVMIQARSNTNQTASATSGGGR